MKKERRAKNDTRNIPERLFVVELCMAEHDFYCGRPGEQLHPETSLGKSTSGTVFSDDCSGDCADYEHIGKAL